MKTKRKLLYGILAITVLSFSFGACREKKTDRDERQEMRKEAREGQALEGVGEAEVVESETIVVEVDSIAADSSKKVPNAPQQPKK